ncbi:MAG: extracellular solute-binding protein [Acidimicrobiales bacterium]|nr:extracellular solute-binding protein [Acidimicrobiales bacterium]
MNNHRLCRSHQQQRRRVLRGMGMSAVAIVSILTGCTKKSAVPTGDNALPKDCVVLVHTVVSSEKIDLLTELAKSFNSQKVKVGGKTACVQPRSKASGGAMQALADGWDERAEGERPVIWSPASSAWGGILDQRLAEKGQPPMAGQGTSFMNTPLVIAMPQPMAAALGYPNTALGWSDILKLTQDPRGWEAYGHPEWGPFRLGKTNPNFSTSGLSALIAQNYAAAGKTRDLSLEDLNRPEVIAYNQDIESSVVHYGDITMTFLNNWYRADQRGTALQYVSAVAVEEKSVIDYNQGNPDGVLDAGEEPRRPRIPLVAIYPKEGTLFSDNPLYVLNAPWVDESEAEAARQFIEFVTTPENQQEVLQFGFRPGNPSVAVGPPIAKDNGVDPDQPQTLLQTPQPPVLVGLLNKWAEQRKGARVLLVIDVSGSMGDPADAKNRTPTKLDLAQQAAIDAVGQFGDHDLVGLRVFSTGMGPGRDRLWLDLVPIGPITGTREQIRTQIRQLSPIAGTPLYDVTRSSFRLMLENYDPERINAVVLLTDGRNEDGNSSDDRQQLQELITELQSQSQGENAKPVRLFTIAYGADADLTTLKSIAEAANGASYNASDPKTINKVFTAVISNF